MSNEHLNLAAYLSSKLQSQSALYILSCEVRLTNRRSVEHCLVFPKTHELLEQHGGVLSRTATMAAIRYHFVDPTNQTFRSV